MLKLGKFSREYYNMENKIFGFQFEPVRAKQSRPNYSQKQPPELFLEI